MVSRKSLPTNVYKDGSWNTYLGNTPWRGRDSDKLELPEELVVGRHLPLALVHLDLNLCLTVRRRGEHLSREGNMCFSIR